MTAHRKQQLVYLIADLMSALLAWVLFLVFRWLVYEGRVFSVDTVLIPAFGFWTPLIIYPIGCAIVYYLSGYYLRPFGKKLTEEFLTTFFSVIAIVMVAFFIIIIDDRVTDYHRYLTSLGVLFVLQFVLCYIPRLGITLWVRRKHPKPDSVIISLPDDAPEEELYARIREEYPTGKEILVVPRVYDILTGAARIGECAAVYQALLRCRCISYNDADSVASVFGIGSSGILLIPRTGDLQSGADWTIWSSVSDL